MPSLGWQELIIVLIIVVIIFGAGKLPEIGGAMGKSIKEFKKEAEEPVSSALSDGSSAAAATTASAATAATVSKSVDPSQVRADEI